MAVTVSGEGPWRDLTPSRSCAGSLGCVTPRAPRGPAARARFATAVRAGAGGRRGLAGWEGLPESAAAHRALASPNLNVLWFRSQHLLLRVPRGRVSVREACALVLCLGHKLVSLSARAGTLTADEGLRPHPFTSWSGAWAFKAQALRGQRLVSAYPCSQPAACPARPHVWAGRAGSPASLPGRA